MIKVFVCDWWYNADCGRAPSHYNLNRHLFSENVVSTDTRMVIGVHIFVPRGIVTAAAVTAQQQSLRGCVALSKFLDGIRRTGEGAALTMQIDVK